MKEQIDELITNVTLRYSTDYFLQPIDNEDKHKDVICTQNYYELFIMLEGSLQYTIDDTAFDLSPMQLVIVPPLTRHSISLMEKQQLNLLVRSMSFHFDVKDSGLFLAYFPFLTNPKIVKLNTIPEIINLIHLISHHISIFSPDEFWILQRSYVIQFLMLLQKFSFAEINNKSPLNHLTLHVIAFINQHLTEKIDIKTLASTLKFTEAYLSKTFKNDMNISIMQYIKQRRLLLVKSLIYGGEKPIQAMYKSGFTDYSNFFKSFVSHFGITPKQMWLQYRKDAPHGKQWKPTSTEKP